MDRAARTAHQAGSPAAGQRRTKIAGSGEPIPSSGLYGAGHSPEGRKQGVSVSRVAPCPVRFCGCAQESARRTMRGQRIEASHELPKGTEYARREPLS
jgi:hypothetical protein